MNADENEIKIVLHSPTELEPVLTNLTQLFNDGSIDQPNIECQDITQGYLNENNRLRKIVELDGKPQHWLSFKQRLPNHHNLEVEGIIEPEVFDAAWRHTKERLTKRRFKIDDPPLKWDIDFYRWQQPYFALAEVELPEGMEKFEPLALIGKYVHFIVPRDDGRFAARRLADDESAKALACELGLL